MEYGRLVVLGYSSYRVATVGTPPRSEASHSHSHSHSHSRASPPLQQQQSFGLGVATGENSAQVNGNGGGSRTDPAAARAPPDSSGRNGVTATVSATTAAGAFTSGSGPPASAPTRNANGNYSSSKKSLGQLWEPIGDQNAQYILQKRKRANGVLLSHFHHFCQKKGLPAASTASVSASSSSSSSLFPVTSKDIKTVTKRMMDAVDMKRALVKESENHDANGSSSGTATTSSSSSTSSSSGDTSSNGNGLKMPLTADTPFLMCVPMNDKDAHASITEYKLDPATDMFQIGRMPCRQNDFVIPGPRVGASGTISRFAARILCSREPPYECRIFAGGFDVTRKMSTAGHALKYCQGCSSWFKKLPVDHVCVASHLLKQEPHSTHSHRPSAQASSSLSRRESNQSSHTSSRDVITTSITAEDMDHLEMEVSDPSEIPIDGVTKNGVRVWLPEHKQWFEVSVNGNLYAIESRTAPATSSRSSTAQLPASGGVVRHSTFNRPSAGSDGVPPILTDGAIIDLGGVQLQFQTNYRSLSQLAGERASLAECDEAAMGRRTNSSVVDQLERLNIQCPVQLHSLRFTPPEPGEETDPLEIPHVFPACGHVFGYEERIANLRMCPLCRHPGFLVKLLLKDNSQLQSAAERNRIPECVLNPCGHAISSKLASYYSKLLMPNGRAICPFCAVHLHPTTPFSRLYLYSEESDQS